MKTVLSIAGSDPSGGAGIQADLKTICAHKLYGMSVITALTAQNTLGVYGVQEASPEFLACQLDAVFSDIFPDSVKIGMLSSAPLIATVAEKLRQYEAKNIILDPVMISTSGQRLLDEEAIRVMIEKLIPLVSLITPNALEAEVLSEEKITDEVSVEHMAKKMYEQYGVAVLIKGGHIDGERAKDFLYDGNFYQFALKRIYNPNNHGTGCTLSTAIACALAEGLSLPQSVKKAKEYLYGALLDGLNLGKGVGPLNHMYEK